MVSFIIFAILLIVTCRVTIIDFRNVGRKGLKNEDKVGQKFI